MTSRPIAPNTLAFIGPVHAPELAEFCYVRVRTVNGDTAVVQVVGPDSDEDGQEVEVPVSKLELRKVDASEAELWPGSYIAHPVAFVQPSGPCVGQWTYCVVVRYEVTSVGTWLSVVSGGQSVSVALSEPLRVIKADPITYALEIGATMSDMVLNPRELLDQQDAAIKASRKRKGDLLMQIRPTLTVPFMPDDLMTLVRPHDLLLTKVRKQHVLDCLTGPRKKNTHDLFHDPQTAAPANNEKAEGSQDVGATRHLDELLSISSTSEDDDIREVRQLNRTLGKCSRTGDSEDGEFHRREHHMDSDNDGYSDDETGRGAFRPSRTQRRVSRTVLHPRFEGKSARYVLERMQQSGHAPFLRLPPVCRGLWELGFVARGLNLMHCRTTDLWDQIQSQDTNISYTDFSERNTLRPAPSAASRSDVSRALRNLRVFAQDFYADAVISVIDSAMVFVDRYRAIADADTMGWKLMAFWITSKLGRFRSFVVARDLVSAQAVQHEFSRVDEELLELMDLRRSHRGVDSVPHRGQHTQETTRRGERQRRQSSVPAAVYTALPRQGDKKMCMKWISAMGCSGNGQGGCFDNKRAHFRPAELPDIVKAHITEKFNGLASETKEE